MKPDTERWVQRAESHLSSAGVLFRAEHYPQAIFLSEQAIECLLKAHWLEIHEADTPPKVHDLVDLAEQLGLGFEESQLAFLRRLQDQYMPTRYVEVAVEYDMETAQFYCESSQVIFEWLRQRLK